MSENTSLVVIGQQQIQTGGIGFSGNNRLFKIQPASIQLVQKMTKAEGAIPGKLRIRETGVHYEEMQLVMIFEPQERRSYFEGDDYSPDNQLCFSVDNVHPHPKAKVPQAMDCANCRRASWEKYRQTNNRADLPKCRNFWHSLVIDRITKLPYYLDVRGTSIKPFTKAMQEIARQYALLQSQGKNPNIFDFSFKIFSEKVPGAAYYVLGFKDIAPIDEADKKDFGDIYLEFLNRKSNTDSVEDLEAKAAAQEAVDAELVEPGTTNAVDGGEITI